MYPNGFKNTEPCAGNSAEHQPKAGSKTLFAAPPAEKDRGQFGSFLHNAAYEHQRESNQQIPIGNILRAPEMLDYIHIPVLERNLHESDRGPGKYRADGSDGPKPVFFK